MKINKVLFSAVVLASLFSCADNELMTVNGGMDNNGLQGKLVDAGLLGIGRDADNEADTRAYSNLGRFMWMPKELTETGGIKNNSNARIGMCWTGMNNENPEYSAATGLSANVYTNYEFEHVGWLDMDATAPSTEECSTSSIDNGAFINGKGTPVANFNLSNVTTYGNCYQYDETTYGFPSGQYNETTHEESTGILHLGKGLFSTENSSVFEGEYLVYFPYTDQFTKGPILASEPVSFDIDVEKNRFKAMSDYAFAIGYVNHYKGGQEMSKIESKTLSAVAGVKLYNYGTTASDKHIKTVILYSKSGILYQTDLNAAKCVAALKNNNLGNGSDLYEATANQKTSHSIYANLNEGVSEYATVTAATDKQDQTPVPVYFPVLSQEVNDLKIILIDENDQTAIVETNDVKKVFTPNGSCVTEINLDDYVFTNTYVAVDEETFISAMSKIKDHGAATPAWNTIKLLNDVVLANVNNTNYSYVGDYNTLFFNKNIRVESEFDAKLTVASGQELYIKSENANATFDINVDVVIEGMGCCGSTVGKLSVGGKQGVVSDVEFAKVTNHGAFALGNVVGVASNIRIEELENIYDEWAVDKSKLTDAASLFFLGNTDSNITIGTLKNQGTVIAKPATVGKPETTECWTDKVNSSIETVPDSRVISVVIRNLTNEVGKGISKADLWNGGKITVEENAIITVTNDLKNNSAEALIDVNGQSQSATDGRLDVKGTSANIGTIDNTGVINFTSSELDNKGLFIDQTSGQVGGKMINNNPGTEGTVTTKYYAGTERYYTTDLGYEGIYVSQVSTVERMAFVLSDAVEYPSTVIVEILGCDTYFYNLSDYKNDLSKKDVFVNSPSKQIAFKAYKAGTPVVLEEKAFGHCVEVFKGSTLVVKDGILSTINNVTVNAGANFNASVSSDNYPETTVEVGGTLINKGNTTHTAKLLKAANIENEGTLLSKSTFEVVNDIVTSGTFTSEGTNNTALNFTETDGEVTFAAQTTTTITGTFNCFDGIFERLGLNGTSQYRATVNVNELGATEGTTSTAWPTEY